MALQASLFGHVQPTSSSSSKHEYKGATLVAFISDTHDSKKKRTAYDNAGMRIASPTEARDTLYRLIWHLYLLPEGRHHLLKGAQTKRARAKGQDNFIRRLHQSQDTLSEYLERQSAGGTSFTMLKLLYAAARWQGAQTGADDDGSGGSGSFFIPASARMCSVRAETDLENRKVVLHCN
ncbi:hypothetical protein LZ31DRAFT_580172 [Colletotrichum somersetense]|nr:hypothetical protein LZ31DRAFT_580172 [Colletotrichum somersetense]